MAGTLLGLDIGSSSIKASLLDIDTGASLAQATSPETELAIDAVRPGWAEQQPETWWEHVVRACAQLRDAGADLRDVQAIGIAYQMHGLVVVDAAREVLRPSIIWCDSRAVEIGNRAFEAIGAEAALPRLLNSPGNFTASKLAWVKEEEPGVFERVDRMMLPGDYIGMKLTGELVTTTSGLSEAILWDFVDGRLAAQVMDHYGFDRGVIPPVEPTFGIHGTVTEAAAEAIGVAAGTPVSYRAGDQPNNALSLNVLEPGEIAATAGTSGVVYGVGAEPTWDPVSRVNTFVHVNHHESAPRYGVLLCVNGTGILYSWMRRLLGDGFGDDGYATMNREAAEAPVGAGGVVVLPFGNGAERVLGNADLGASVHGLGLTVHDRRHLLRAAQEGIVFALNYGLSVMRDMGVAIRTVRAGHGNMFLSTLFAEAFATVTGATLELFNTDGAQGAARGAAIGAGIWDPEDAFVGLETIRTVDPDRELVGAYQDAYGRWEETLARVMVEDRR